MMGAGKVVISGVSRGVTCLVLRFLTRRAVHATHHHELVWVSSNMFKVMERAVYILSDLRSL